MSPAWIAGIILILGFLWFLAYVSGSVQGFIKVVISLSVVVGALYLVAVALENSWTPFSS